MMKNIKFQFIFILGSLFFLNSCTLEDEGNYVYKDINEVVFEGLLKSNETYEVPRFDNLSINTDNIKLTQDSDGSGSYEYSWKAVSTNSLDDEIYELSTQKSIDSQILLLPGTYTLYYLVKDLNTGVEWQHKTNLKVINSIYEGWMVLNDVAGESRLDMVSLLSGEYKVIPDVLDFSFSPLKLTGKPGFVQAFDISPSLNGIYVSTSGNGTTRLDDNTFDWRKSNNLSYEFTTSQTENFEASNLYVKAQGMSAVFKDTDFYVYNRIYRVSYSTPQNVDRFGQRFDASPYIGKGGDLGGFANMAIYDNTNKKFVYHTGYFSYCYDVLSSDPMFAPGKDLRYMVSTTFNGDQTFAVLKDPTTGKNHIGMFEVRGFSSSHYSEILATDFDQAEHIAIDPTYAYIMYNVGGKVYEYDIFTQTTKEMIDKGGDVITKLEYRKFFNTYSNTSYAKMSKQLIVCSYDPTGPEGSNGTMELYNVPPTQGDLTLDASYSGFGKIVSIAYRER